ncbi:aldo/keto reductase [Paenibacillus sp. YPG26]|uniref:aldo/keto reductase n=1 Tax=Paenibacillus sp. YPG26 TaxID=2878915 RepID=UPI00203EDC44|nr:aldo/keto reductase [Paenibacillus sp. YPG26]USB31935.1 aldo/keto reductase [Paenibacillus sp. YPG26]
MPNHLQDTVRLNNGVEMPWFGLGVWQVKDGDEVVSSVKTAIRHGYRSIDTAAAYKNEEGVGQAIREALQENGLKRDELFITTKVWNADQGYESTLAAIDDSLGKLGLDYVDLYLIHWPVKGKYKETWKALEKIYQDGKARAIGVCNFQVHHLEDLMADAKIIPALNQIELHPYLSQKEIRDFCAGKGIAVEAWSPLAQGKVVKDETIQAIGDKYGKTAAQVVLRWDLQSSIITIPKSVHEERITGNADIFNFELSPEDMAAIDSLNLNERTGPDPDNFNF